MTTVGDLTGNDLYRSIVTLEFGDSTIRGLITELGFTTSMPTLAGPNLEVTVRIGGVTVEHLPLNTPAAVSRSSKA